MTTISPPLAEVAGARRIATRALGIVAGLLALFLVGGVFALAAGFFEGGEGIIHRIHGVAFGGLMTFGIGVPFLLQAHAPERKVSPLQAVPLVVVLLLIVGAVAGVAAETAPFAIALVFAAAIAAVHPARRALAHVGEQGMDRVLLLLAAAGTVPLLTYAWQQIDLQRTAPSTNPHAVEAHYGGTAGLAVGILVLAYVAAARATGHRITALMAGLSAVSLGTVSLLNRGFESALPEPWAVAAIAGGIAFVVAARRRTG